MPTPAKGTASIGAAWPGHGNGATNSVHFGERLRGLKLACPECRVPVGVLA